MVRFLLKNLKNTQIISHWNHTDWHILVLYLMILRIMCKDKLYTLQWKHIQHFQTSYMTVVLKMQSCDLQHYQATCLKCKFQAPLPLNHKHWNASMKSVLTSPPGTVMHSKCEGEGKIYYENRKSDWNNSKRFVTLSSLPTIYLKNIVISTNFL